MNLKKTIAVLLALTWLPICTDIASATPYCQPCPYDCDDIGLGHKDCSELPGSDHSCCVDLTRKGLELAEAQNAVDVDDEDDEECPSGFEESERKCSSEERADGCRDIRLDNGTGCVSR